MKTLRIFEREEPHRPIIIPVNQIKYVKRGTDDRFLKNDVNAIYNTANITFLDGEVIDGYIFNDDSITEMLEK